MVELRYLGLTANELAKIASDLDAENVSLQEYVDRLERQAIANAPTSWLKETKAQLNQMRRLCWLEERW